MPLVDAHTHYNRKDESAIIGLLEQSDMYAMCSGGSKIAAEEALSLASASTRIIPTVGLHPWHAKDGLDTMIPYLDKAGIIGEIGLDTVWTDVPLDLQRDVFEQQLLYAERKNKPVLLHTKGAEREITGHIAGRTLPAVIVHWYSGGKDELKDLIDFGCYFTLGPDLAVNPAVQAVALLVPEDRILTETDGAGAVEWATGKHCDLSSLPGVISANIAAAAKIRGVSPEGLEAAIWNNFTRILSLAV